MRVLVACEFSGIVRDAFRARGHDAWSCDLLDTEAPGPHYKWDVRDIIGPDWDLLIGFPPCTYLTRSGGRYWAERWPQQEHALMFVETLLDAPIERIAIENPIGIISTAIRKPDQIIQPWQHGHGETKSTCLWLKKLPLLQPSKIVEGRDTRVGSMPDRKNRWKDRSRTLPGVADAMADQWGCL